MPPLAIGGSELRWDPASDPAPSQTKQPSGKPSQQSGRSGENRHRWKHCRRCPFHYAGHLLTQHLTSTRQPLLDGVGTDIECCGDFRHRLLLAIEQDQRLAVVLGDHFECVPNERLFLA